MNEKRPFVLLELREVSELSVLWQIVEVDTAFDNRSRQQFLLVQNVFLFLLLLNLLLLQQVILSLQVFSLLLLLLFLFLILGVKKQLYVLLFIQN